MEWSYFDKVPPEYIRLLQTFQAYLCEDTKTFNPECFTTHAEATAARLIQFFNDKKYKDNTQHKYIAAICAFLREIGAPNDLYRSLLRSIDTTPITQDSHKHDTIDKLTAALNDTSNTNVIRVLCATILYGMTSLALGEILTAQFSTSASEEMLSVINLETNIWTVMRKTKIREYPLTAEFRSFIDTILTPYSAKLVTGRGNYTSLAPTSRAFLAKVGISFKEAQIIMRSAAADDNDE